MFNKSKKKKIVIIDASPVYKTCNAISGTFFDKLEADRYEATYYPLYMLDIHNCIDCEFCRHKKGCRFDKEDDMIRITNSINESDGVIVISPIHFDMLPAMFMTMLSRCNSIYHSKYTLNDSLIDRDKYRNGMFIYVGGSKPYEGQFEHAEHVGRFFFKAMNIKYNIDYKFHSTDIEKVNTHMLDDLYNLYMEKIKKE